MWKYALWLIEQKLSHKGRFYGTFNILQSFSDENESKSSLYFSSTRGRDISWLIPDDYFHFGIQSQFNCEACPFTSFFFILVYLITKISWYLRKKAVKPSIKGVRRWLRHIMEDPKNVISTCNEMKRWWYPGGRRKAGK